ncbi:MAG TPA: type VI secretion system baseplate subunit TssF [Candidatus Entotheonella sp.]|jgi:type VI secretion system protein ImpG
MPDELLRYYERELSFVRQMGAEFASKYPRIAGRLLLEADKCEDPHVERLIQAFAFLTARVHHKLDDEFPELTDALLGVLYPHYLAPIPSLAIVQFALDPTQGLSTSGYPLPKGTALYSRPVDGMACRFRTCYPVTLWPIQVASVRLDEPDRRGPAQAVSMLRLRLQCLGGAKLSELKCAELRFFLHGESPLVYRLYELLFNHTMQVQLRAPDGASESTPVRLPPECLRAVGFAPDEGVLPYPARSFMGYRLLQEYFSFPSKFLFFDLCQLDRAMQAGCRDSIEVCLYLNRAPRLEQPVTPENFRLGCTPIVNLFEQIAEPIRLNHAETEYRVIPDVRRQSTTEVYAIDSVTCTSPQLDEPIEVQPFYSIRHADNAASHQSFWHATRQPSPRKGDAGTEVVLSLVDLNFQPTLPPAETLTLRITCTNRDLPGKLPFGGNQGEFEIEGAVRVRSLTKPTETVRAPLQRGAQWRLISHLSLNYLSISEGGREALQEILRLYDFSDSAVVRQQIAGITNVTSRRVVGRPASMPWNGFCRGVEVSIEFDEEKYIGSGVFLFASVLEKFLGLYASLNSFTQMIAHTLQREEPLKRWPLRAGEQILL